MENTDNKVTLTLPTKKAMDKIMACYISAGFVTVDKKGKVSHFFRTFDAKVKVFGNLTSHHYEVYVNSQNVYEGGYYGACCIIYKQLKEQDVMFKWAEAFAMMDLGETVKVEPKVYFDALEALPPAFSAVRIDDNCNYFAMGEMAKHADDGTPMYHSFWTTVDHKCYGCLCPLPYIKVEKIPADIKDAKEVYNG